MADKINQITDNDNYSVYMGVCDANGYAHPTWLSGAENFFEF